MAPQSVSHGCQPARYSPIPPRGELNWGATFRLLLTCRECFLVNLGGDIGQGVELRDVTDRRGQAWRPTDQARLISKHPRVSLPCMASEFAAGGKLTTCDRMQLVHQAAHQMRSDPAHLQEM